MIDQPSPSSTAPLRPNDLLHPEQPTAHQRPLWMLYALAILLTLATMLIRLMLGFKPGDPPTLVLFTLPIMLSAYLGGLGPGLVTTVLAVLLTNYVLLPPYYAFSIATQINLLQSGGLFVAGTLISVLSEGLHRARRKADADRRLQAVTLASIGDGVITTDAQGHITLLNAEAERLTGWPRAEAIGQPLAAVFRIVNAHTHALIDDPAAEVLRAKRTPELPTNTLLLSRNDRATPIDQRVAPIGGADSTARGVVVIFRDIAEREQAEAMRAQLAAIVEFSNDAIIGKDLQGIVTSWNAGAKRLFGYTASDMIGQSITRIIPLDRQDEEATILARIMRGEGIDHFETMRQRKDTTLVDVSVTVSPIRDHHGQIVGASKVARDISASKRTEAALRQSEAHFATAFRASPTAMSITHLQDGRFIDINASHERLFGYPRAELIGQHADTINIYANPDQRAKVVQIMREQGSLHDAELTLRTRSGELREVLCALELLEIDGEAYMLGSVFDITDRKRAETALRASEERFRQVFVANPSPELITRADNHQIVNANPGFAQMTGYALNELLGQTTDALGLWQESSPIAETRAQLQQAGQLTNHEMPIRTRDGSVRDLLLSVVPVELDGVACFLTVMLDQTDRKQAVQALEHSAERLRVLSDASRSFAEVGTEYQALLSYVARKTTEVLGDGCSIRLLSDDALWLDLVALYDVDAEKLQLTRLVLGETPLRVDEPSLASQIFHSRQPLLLPVVDQEQARAATKPVYWSLLDRLGVHSRIVVPMRVQGRTIGILGVYRYQREQLPFDTDDLTLAQDLADRAALAISNARLLEQVQHELAERTNAEQALEAERALLTRRVAERTSDLSVANAELARAARLKDEFLASMSHELRTPLNSVLGRSELLQEEIYGALTPKQLEVVRGIEESGRHLLALINDILDLSKIEAGKLDLQLAPVAVALLCRMSLRMVAQTALQKHISVTSTIDSQVTTIAADERRLKQILLNLLSNAVKFTPDGGQVGLEVQGDIQQQSVTFTVWDTGIGIAEDDLPQLFKPFVQIDSSLSRQYAGTGLGLALVLRLAQAHAGSVTLASTPGQGSRFSVTLPWNPVEENPLPLPEVATADISIPPVYQALVIEDSPTAAAQVARYLTDLGANVTIQTEGSGAVEQAMTSQPDVIVLDILLPDQTGWDILRQLRAEPRTQAIPVVIVSVVDEPKRARALGAAAFLLKPIDRAVLIQTLRQIIPATAEPPVRTALVIGPSPAQPRILLAEDNQANIDLLQDYLAVKGYDVVIVRTGNEALMRAQEAPPALILMDIQMPGMDGLEAIQRIRADSSLRSIPILVLTALAMPGDRERCLAAGADDYLTKPVNLRTLLARIDAQLHQRKEHSHDIAPDDSYPNY